MSCLCLLWIFFIWGNRNRPQRCGFPINVMQVTCAQYRDNLFRLLLCGESCISRCLYRRHDVKLKVRTNIPPNSPMSVGCNIGQAVTMHVCRADCPEVHRFVPYNLRSLRSTGRDRPQIGLQTDERFGTDRKPCPASSGNLRRRHRTVAEIVIRLSFFHRIVQCAHSV